MADITIDARGKSCPIPVVMTTKELSIYLFKGPYLSLCTFEKFHRREHFKIFGFLFMDEVYSLVGTYK